MKETELRIGNLVIVNHRYDRIVDVKEIRRDAVVCMFMENESTLVEYHADFEAVHPIPLTSDILQKAGLDNKVWPTLYALGSFYLTTKYELDNELHFYKSNLEIKYVHQLQNLYFALTNEELPIDEIPQH